MQLFNNKQSALFFFSTFRFPPPSLFSFAVFFSVLKKKPITSGLCLLCFVETGGTSEGEEGGGRLAVSALLY
jgi:hypothetical protein